MRKYLNRRSIITLLALFICIFSLSAGAATWAHMQQYSQLKIEYEANVQRDTERVISYFSGHLTAGIQSCYSIFSSRWYTHYRNVADIYADEFDGMRKIELLEDLNARITALALVSDILIITPPQNTIICHGGWFTYERYRLIYDTVRVSSPNGFTESPEVELVDSNYCAITLQDSAMRRGKGVICLLVSKKEFISALNRILPDSISYVRAELADQLLYTSGKLTADMAAGEAYHPTSDLTLAMGSPSFDSTIGAQQRLYLLLILTVMLFTSALLALGITAALIKPISDLIIRFGGKAHDLESPYQFIHQYVDAFEAQRTRLRHENVAMQREHERFISVMRNEIMFGMLTNPEFNFNSDYARSLMPCLAEKLPCVLVLLEQKYRSNVTVPAQRWPELAAVGAAHTCRCILGEGCCFILWFADESKAVQAMGSLPEAVNALGIYYFAISETVSDMSVLSARYHQLETDVELQRHAWLDLPISIQINLASKIRSRKPDDCAALIEAQRHEISPDVFLWLLMRIAAESGFDMEPVIQEYGTELVNAAGDPWCVLIRCARDMARVESKPSAAAENNARQLVRYIDENYADSGLCVNGLADLFSLHRTIVSKAVKAETGDTFTDYLTGLRTRKAAELMNSSELPIATIAEQAGFASYATFKRAFIKRYGCSPREYRERDNGSPAL